MRSYPANVYSGVWKYGHCQGICADLARGYMYYSFTTALIKTDFSGKLIGSVKGLVGHLGCIAYDSRTNRVYGSLEYKNDEIGRGIRKRLGSQAESVNAFYMAVFEADAITRPDMDASEGGVMRAAYLREVAEDYSATVRLIDGREVTHRYGCSGIDGTAIGPMFGEPSDSKKYLFVAYGIYGDTSRKDNDYQVLLAYDMDEIDRTLQPLAQSEPHESGPASPVKKLFAYTGNTTYGIQNLEYDEPTKCYLAAVYIGAKSEYPNLPLYRFDAAIAPVHETLKGVYPEEAGDTVALKPGAIIDTRSGISGYSYPWGQTGLFSLSDGRFYVSYDGRKDDGWDANIRLCAWDGQTPIKPIEEV